MNTARLKSKLANDNSYEQNSNNRYWYGDKAFQNCNIMISIAYLGLKKRLYLPPLRCPVLWKRKSEKRQGLNMSMCTARLVAQSKLFWTLCWLIQAGWRIYVSMNRSALFQLMACRPFGTKPLSESMLNYYRLNRHAQNPVNFQPKWNIFDEGYIFGNAICQSSAIMIGFSVSQC